MKRSWLGLAAIVVVFLTGCNLASPTRADLVSPDLQQHHTIAFSASADSWVSHEHPKANFGTSSELKVDGSPVKRSYLRFDITGVSGKVTGATLRLYDDGNGSVAGPAVYLTGNAWTEKGITWNDRPSRLSGVLDTAGRVRASSWIGLDVTKAVVGNGTYSFELASSSSDGVLLSSREAADHRPELVVTVQVSGTAVAAQTPTVAVSATPPPANTGTPVATQTPVQTSTSAPAPTPTATSGLPSFGHVYLIVMENKEYDSIVGSPKAPYINSLLSKYSTASNYYAVTHPSQPNYIALFSGSTHGVTDDDVHNVSGRNLADQLETKGRSWKVFAENYPGGCYTDKTATGGEDGSGTYARKHNPAISFTDVNQNYSRCASHITDLKHFDPAAASFEMIVPNLCNDMHDCPVSSGDSFLEGFLPRILESQAWKQGGVIFLTFDEGDSDVHGGGHVLTIAISPYSRPGYHSPSFYDHYSLLRTIEDAWGLGCLEKSCDASSMKDLFRTGNP